MLANSIVRSEVTETQFGLYTDEELRDLSVCKITSPLARDGLGNALHGGLYDPRMGATDFGQTCVTCNANSLQCPGHCGHVELDFPVYHPLLFGNLFQLVRSSCTTCKKFRMDETRIWRYLCKLKLLDMDDVSAAQKLDDQLLPSQILTEEGGIKNAGVDTVVSKAEKTDEVEKFKDTMLKVLTAIDERYKVFCEVTAADVAKFGTRKPPSVHAKNITRGVVEEFNRDLASCQRCQNCSTLSSSVRKDGSNKIFQSQSSTKRNVFMSTKARGYGNYSALEFLSREKQRDENGGCDLMSEDEDDTPGGLLSQNDSQHNSTDEEDISASEDDDSDSDSDSGSNNGDAFSKKNKPKSALKKSSSAITASKPEEKKEEKKKDAYLPPMEVEAIVELLWRYHPEIMDFIWSRATGGSALAGGDSVYGALNSIAKKSTDSKHHNNSSKMNSNGWRIFFLRCVLVPPNRFRPAAHIGDSVSDHPQNVHLTNIIETNQLIVKMNLEAQGESAPSASGNLRDLISNGSQVEAPTPKAPPSGAQAQSLLSRTVTQMIALQNNVNIYIDSNKDPNPLGSNAPAGIRQLLEKKEGLFRMHMMGKRVNYCCRSVISPDNNIGSNEIGIPVRFAKALHYPTPVNEWNAKHLRTLVERGADQYPGANQIETHDGKIIKLDKLTLQERVAKAKLLLATPGNKVYRHLVTGDSLLVNRQPSLHKCSIMAHKARVLTHIPEQTLRMHYANCSSYNADFDGDEMNCHFVQNELARAEATHIMNTSNQYHTPTSGMPLRGLIQDHVVAGVKLTWKNTFLKKAEFMQLVHIATSGLEETEIVGYHDNVIIPPPAIRKPVAMWTGKQVITALISNLIRAPLPPLNLDGKTRTPVTALGEDSQEHVIIFRDNQLLSGLMDKASIGATNLGIVHAVYELYGAEPAGLLLGAFGRLFSYYLQDAGQTCGMEDLVLTTAAEKERSRLMSRVLADASVGLRAFIDGDAIGEKVEAAQKAADKTEAKQKKSNKNSPTSGDDVKKVNKAGKLEQSFYGINPESIAECESSCAMLASKEPDQAKIKLDAAMQSVINKSASSVIKACTPAGLKSDFQKNNFSVMVLTGAKGSAVNQSSISCMLGQQALEGQRVPLMVSGKSLPSFRPYDAQIRAHGFVQDRFLTGVKPQEYYFHCMAGREGLVDTAVKTSRSGYLQRCLVKHLEELKVNYDNTVRDSGGNIIQFLYGEDGIDPCSSAILKGNKAEMTFLARNASALTHKYALNEAYFTSGGMDHSSATEHNTRLHRARKLLDKSSKAPDMQASSGIAGIAETLPKSTSSKDLKKAVLLARRRRISDLPWSRSNMLPRWESAEVIKVRSKGESDGKDSKSSKKKDKSVAGFDVPESVDLKYLSDNKIEKRVPLCIFENGLKTKGTLSLPIIKPGLPDPAMSSLRLDTCVGAVSENMQRSVDDYIETNPDNLINEDVEEGLKAAGLEMLIWVRCLKSMVQPGEAVGCVAAQSVGEPSTQMTLNTFHLAGSGANVTMGIPRIREIVMTASRNLKTPTMTVPLQPGMLSKDARAMSRQLSVLTLHQLLHHQGGVTVGEEVLPTPAGETKNHGLWVRKYRVRLQFADLKRIKEAFGLNFDDLLQSVSKTFNSRLNNLVQKEQRRSGEKLSSKLATNAAAFLGSSKRAKSDAVSDPKSKADGSAQAGDDLSDSDDEMNTSSSKGKNKNRNRASSIESDKGEGADNKDKDNIDGLFSSDDESEKDSDDEASYNDENDLSEDEDAGVDEDVKKYTSINNKKQEENESSKKNRVSFGGAASGEQIKIVPNPSSSKVSVRKGVLENEEEGWIETYVILPAKARRLLMIQLAESAADITKVREVKHIEQAYDTKMEILDYSKPAPITTGGKRDKTEVQAVQTEGVNFEAIWSLSPDKVEHRDIASNDIYQVLLAYGVEAAKASITNEINGVFGVYGINVNPRHLSLIADFMTRTGSYVAMNRQGMSECGSPYVQMSYETTTQFLTRAALDGTVDNQQSPSARIVLGSPMKHGTGCFEIMVPVQQKQSSKVQDVSEVLDN